MKLTVHEYNQLNEHVAEYSRINALLEKAEADIKLRQLKAAESLLPEHSELKLKLTAVSDQARKLTETHEAELFPDDKQSHQTPFGALAWRKSEHLEYDDKEKVLLRIKLACERELADAKKQNRQPLFTVQQFIRTHEEPNLEALGDHDDASLAMFGITRKREEKFSIKPLEMKSDKPAKAERKAA